jgi:hypothetical protein
MASSFHLSLDGLFTVPRAYLPKLLFRVCTNRLQQHPYLQSHAIFAGKATTPFCDQSIDQFEHEIRHHLDLKFRTRPSRLMSWSASLLATLQRALHLQFKGELNISIAILNTSNLTEEDVILPVPLLLQIFEMDWSDYAQRQFSIEYLMYEQISVGKIDQIRLDTLVHLGLDDLCPLLFKPAINGIGNNKVWLRHEALQDALFHCRAPSSVSPITLDLAYCLASSWASSHPQLQLPLTIAFLSLENRHPLDAEILSSIQMTFASLTHHPSMGSSLCNFTDPALAEATYLMPELDCFTRLMRDVEISLTPMGHVQSLEAEQVNDAADLVQQHDEIVIGEDTKLDIIIGPLRRLTI